MPLSIFTRRLNQSRPADECFRREHFLDLRRVTGRWLTGRAAAQIDHGTVAGGQSLGEGLDGARVAEDDLHAGWERLLHNWTRKDPSTVGLLKARLGFPLIFERTLIELTPRRTWFWPDGRTDHAPQITVAAEVAR